jgi:hypothetical protein
MQQVSNEKNIYYAIFGGVKTFVHMMLRLAKDLQNLTPTIDCPS